LSADNQFKQNEAMPRIDVLKDVGRLKSTDIVYMRRLEEQNLQRAKRVQEYRKANNRTAFALALGVIGIYAYTIYSVKQEKFLDDFEMPEKTVEKA